MNNKDKNKYLAEIEARRFQEELDGQNRCNRCHRPLSDPTADYGWRCEQILGVNQHNAFTEPLSNYQTDFDSYNPALDSTAQTSYNDFAEKSQSTLIYIAVNLWLT